MAERGVTGNEVTLRANIFKVALHPFLFGAPFVVFAFHFEKRLPGALVASHTYLLPRFLSSLMIGVHTVVIRVEIESIVWEIALPVDRLHHVFAAGEFEELQQ